MKMITLKGVSKAYGKEMALRDLDIDIKEGEIYGFLGPNGAGKTTAIKIMMGLIRPDRGEAFIMDQKVSQAGAEVRKHIGYLPEKVSFYGDLTILENLEFFKGIKGFPDDNIKKLIDDFQIDEDPDKKVRALSKGKNQRLGLAQCMIGGPDILILDEPTSGLDPEIRRWVKNKIIRLKDRGKTIFLSSHILAEVQELCDRVGVISNGEMIAEDGIDVLTEELELNDKMELTFEGGRTTADEALDILNDVGCVERPRIEGETLILYCVGNNKMDIIEELLDRDFEIKNFSVEEPDLEEVFLKLMEGER